MDPREYDWQMGDLAYLDPNFGPDERRMQPPAPERAWPVPTRGMAPWPYMEQPAQGEARLAQQAREAAAYRLRNPYQTAATRPPESNRLTQVASAIGSMPGAMGELAAIPAHTMADNPYPPGSEEADFYERARKSNVYQKAPEAAFNLMGAGTTFAPTGAIGMAGGKLRQQSPTGFVPGSVLGTGTGIKKASPEEITKAAAESRKGMTQPELRNLYDELGLTKSGTTEVVQPSLAQSQPRRAVKEATELKFLDREMLDTLTKRQRAIYQDKGDLPEGMILPSQEAAGEGKAEFQKLKKEVTKAEAAFDKEAERGFRPMSIFDLRPDTLKQVPDVGQYPLPRVEPKLTDRMRPAGQGGLGRIERAASRAPEENWGWYNLMQTRNIMHAIHGPERGEQVFRNWVDGIAGTSMLNPIDNNIRSSTWYLQQILQGKPLPEVVNLADPVTGKTVQTIAGGPPAGYGAKSQVQHAARVRDFLTNDYDPVANAKPISYRENLLGNWMPRTVDTHDIRNLVGMPRGLAFKNKPLLPGEYTYLEDIGGRAAARAGTSQGPQQAATWIGGGEYTGLKSYPAPFLSALDRRAQVTAAVRGITPMEALIESFTKGGRPLLGVGGTVVGAASVRDRMGGLAAQDEYEYQ